MSQLETDDSAKQGIIRSVVRFFQPSVETLIEALDGHYPGFLMGPDAAEQKLIKRGKEVVPQLMAVAESREPSAAVRVVRILGKIGDPRAAEAVAKMVDHDEARYDGARREVVPALANMGEKGRELLPPLQSSYDAQVRSGALRVLAKAGSGKALNQLVSEMKDNNANACEALGDFLENPAVADALLRKYAEVEAHFRKMNIEDIFRGQYYQQEGPVSMAARRVLSSNKGQARSALFAALGSKNPDVAEVAANLLVSSMNHRDERERELVFRMLGQHNKGGKFAEQMEYIAGSRHPSLGTEISQRDLISGRKVFGEKLRRLIERRAEIRSEKRPARMGIARSA